MEKGFFEASSALRQEGRLPRASEGVGAGLKSKGAQIGLVGAVAAFLLAIAGCERVAPDPTEPPLRPDLDFGKILVANARPSLSADEVLLGVGHFWRYRDMTAGHLPTHPPAPDVLVEVLATVATQNGVACYVVREGEVGGEGTLRYLHRGDDGLFLYGEGGDGKDYLVEPPAPVLPLPLTPGTTWSYETSGEIYDGRVLFQEALATSAGVFRAWKVEVGKRGSSEVESRWYAPGLGVVKRVQASRSYELADGSLLHSERTFAVDAAASGNVVEVRVGDTLVVELPTEEGTPYAWRVAEDLDRSALVPLDEGRFFADLLPEPSAGPTPGTFVFRVRAVKATPSGPLILSLRYARSWDERPAYLVSIGVLVRSDEPTAPLTKALSACTVGPSHDRTRGGDRDDERRHSDERGWLPLLSLHLCDFLDRLGSA